MTRLLAAALPLALALPLQADAGLAPETGSPASERPAILREVRFDQRLDQRLPLDLTFRDEDGKTARLGDYFGKKPIVLSFAYFRCPMLCPMVLDGLVRSLRPLSLGVGEDFDVITVSFDPRDPPALASEKKRDLVASYGRPSAASGWHFLTGTPEAVERLTEAAGFHYAYDAEHDQFAHPAGVLVLTPEGKIARYLFGVDPAPRDLRLALVEASANRIGTLADQLLLFCFHYDPASGKYGAIAMNAVRVGGIVTVLGLGLLIGGMLRSEGSRPKV